jgi:signal peptidase I
VEEFQSQAAPVNKLTEPGRSSLYRSLVDVLETLLLALVLFIGINAVSARIRVDGSSMEPTLHNGEFIIVNKLAYRLGEPRLGDVIVFRFPNDPGQDYIKRVIGVPGDRIEVSQGHVSVNGKMLDEPYIAAMPNYSGDWTVPTDALFVLGDNRNNSSDSRNWGPVTMEAVIGKALLIYWPPEQWGAIAYNYLSDNFK